MAATLRAGSIAAAHAVVAATADSEPFPRSALQGLRVRGVKGLRLEGAMEAHAKAPVVVVEFNE